MYTSWVWNWSNFVWDISICETIWDVGSREIGSRLGRASGITKYRLGEKSKIVGRSVGRWAFHVKAASHKMLLWLDYDWNKWRGRLPTYVKDGAINEIYEKKSTVLVSFSSWKIKAKLWKLQVSTFFTQLRLFLNELPCLWSGFWWPIPPFWSLTFSKTNRIISSERPAIPTSRTCPNPQSLENRDGNIFNRMKFEWNEIGMFKYPIGERFKKNFFQYFMLLNV